MAAEAGNRLSTFGAGADAGREASWTGSAVAFSDHGDWSGYSVLQAKHREFPEAPASNLTWLKRQLRKDIKGWGRAKKEGTRVPPENYLVTTNVRLSASEQGGKFAIAKWLNEEFRKQGINLTGWRIWDYDDMRVILDRHAPIRKTYRALITPGDVLFDLVEPARYTQGFDLALRLHAAEQMRREHRLKLGQAGEAKDTPLAISAVFTDLPYFTTDIHGRATNVTRHLFQSFDVNANREKSTVVRVLIGGPGQGKSTVSQFISLAYRAAFLGGSKSIADAETAQIARDLEANQTRNDLPIAKRRWAARIVLSELADSLASHATNSILDYLAEEVSKTGRIATSTDLGNWMEDHPWLLVLDGLDEVPAKDDRDRLVSTIANFVAHANTIGADVQVIATTRPQGYTGELVRAREVMLAPLAKTEAMNYAEQFLRVRNGADNAANDRTRIALGNAMRTDATRRLFESPLQVTILAILLERLGHAPSDRWQLFWNYYQVIMQREQEKPGELADLLRGFTSDINFLHRKIGLLLHERSAQAGRASSVLSTTEFADIVYERLLDMEHPPHEAKILSDRLLALSTERLVFLARLSGDAIGFEIRSIQEFMTAEQIVLDRPEVHVIPTLREHALSPHWRNVILFAAGRIFYEKDLLKPAIDHLCAELDSLNPAHALAMTGARLALDILLDGACNNQPKYAKTLGTRAATLMSAVDARASIGLDRVTGVHAREVIQREARRHLRGDDTPPFGAFAIRAREADRGDESGTRALSEFLKASSPVALLRLLRFGWGFVSPSLDKLLSEVVSEVRPSTFTTNIIEGYHRYSSDPGSDSSTPNGDSNILAWLRAMCSPPAQADRYPVRLNAVDLRLSLVLRRVNARQAITIPTTADGAASKEWRYVQLAASVASAVEVANLLEMLDEEPSLADIPVIHCWLIEALVKAAGSSSEGDGSQLAALARRVRDGDFGDLPDWLAAEERLSSEGVDLGMTPAAISDASDLPLARRLDVLVMHGGAFEGSAPFESASLDACLEDVERLLKLIEEGHETWQQATFIDLAYFILSLCSAAVRDDEELVDDIDDLASKQHLIKELATRLLKQGIPENNRLSGALWVDWTAELGAGHLLELHHLADRQLMRPAHDRATAARFLQAASEFDARSLTRLALMLDPTIVFETKMFDKIEIAALDPATQAVIALGKASADPHRFDSVAHHAFAILLQERDPESIYNYSSAQVWADALKEMPGRRAMPIIVSTVNALRDTCPLLATSLIPSALTSVRTSNLEESAS